MQQIAMEKTVLGAAASGAGPGTNFQLDSHSHSHQAMLLLKLYITRECYFLRCLFLSAQSEWLCCELTRCEPLTSIILYFRNSK